MNPLEDRLLHPDGRLLVRLERSAGRREELKALARWSRGTNRAVVALPAEEPLYADFRALGFEDAGPLARFEAPTAPGRLRRAALKLFKPSLRPPSGAAVSTEPLGSREESALRERLRPGFGALPAPGPTDPAGVTISIGGEPVAFARFAPGEEIVREWLAPADAPDLAGLLALETARRAGGRRVAFETSHVRLGHGLVLGGFLPARARARVLVRGGEQADAATFGLTRPLDVMC